MDIAAHIFVFLIGLYVVLGTLTSAIKTFVLPRSSRARLSTLVFLVSRKLFDIPVSRYRTYEQRDRLMALYAPMTLLVLPAVWLTLVLLGYTGIYWGLGVSELLTAFKVSGSSLLTLGFATVDSVPVTVAAFTEASIGLVLVALLISYLPTMYNAFSKRETAVTMLEIRAGSPPSAVTLFERFHRLGRFDKLNEMWTLWEIWFAEVEESHTSLAVLPFFRSPQPEHSWITAAGAVLDAAALYNALLDAPRDPQADLCIRAGYLALRDIASFFRLQLDAIPGIGDPMSAKNISVTRAEFDAACAEMESQGVPLKADRDQAWKDFVGWRVLYDKPLIALCAICMAPVAPWSSDRARQWSPSLRTIVAMIRK